MKARAATGPLASWGHPNIRVADARLNWRRQIAGLRARGLYERGTSLATIAAWFELSEDDIETAIANSLLGAR